MTDGRVNENVVRLVAALVLILALATIATAWVFIPIYLAVDFFLRAFTTVKPPFAIIAKWLATQLKLEEKPIFAAPKKFAAGVGFVFSVTISALLLLHLDKTAMGVTYVLAFFALLESAFSICAGCYVYSYIVAPLREKFKF